MEGSGELSRNQNKEKQDQPWALRYTQIFVRKGEEEKWDTGKDLPSLLQMDMTKLQ